MTRRVGVAIDETHVRAAAVKTSRKKVTITGLARVPLTPGVVVAGSVRDPEALAAAVRDAVADLPGKVGTRGATVCANLANQLVTTVVLPAATATKEVPAYLRETWLAELPSLPWLSEAHQSTGPLPRRKRVSTKTKKERIKKSGAIRDTAARGSAASAASAGLDIRVAVTSYSEVAALLEVVEGLAVRSLDVSAAALVRALDLPETTEPLALVHLGEQSVVVAVVDVDRTLRGARTLPTTSVRAELAAFLDTLPEGGRPDIEALWARVWAPTGAHAAQWEDDPTEASTTPPAAPEVTETDVLLARSVVDTALSKLRDQIIAAVGSEALDRDGNPRRTANGTTMVEATGALFTGVDLDLTTALALSYATFSGAELITPVPVAALGAKTDVGTSDLSEYLPALGAATWGTA